MTTDRTTPPPIQPALEPAKNGRIRSVFGRAGVVALALALFGAVAFAIPATASAATGATLHVGSDGSKVAMLQYFLDKNKHHDYLALSGSYTTHFGDVTKTALRKWEKANKRTVDGRITVSSKEWNLLRSQVKKPKLDQRCLKGALVVCASKKNKRLYVVEHGKVTRSYDARFGRPGYETRNGVFHIFRISGKNAVSSEYHTPMPFAMTFSGGQAVHYSPSFAANGYYGGSHGCINLRDYGGTKWLNREVRIGTKVVVYK